MQEQFALDTGLIGLAVNIFLTVVTTIIAALSLHTSRRVSAIETKIKEKEFEWRSRERVRRELVSNLKFGHVLKMWAGVLQVVGSLPESGDIEHLTKQLKPIVDDYGEIIPEAIALHNELELGMLAGEYTNQKQVLELSSRVVELIPPLEARIQKLEEELAPLD